MRKNLLFLSGIVLLAGCSAPKQIENRKNEQKDSIANKPLVYKLYFKASRTRTSPPDEITIDTNGQMVTLSQQQMSDGSWRTPKGIAKLEPDDAEIIQGLVSDSLLYEIKEDDVLPPCSDGADYSIRIERLDRKQILAIKTNTCAVETNTLSGEQRSLLRKMITQFEKMRSKYRPQFKDKG